jgi:TonB family protein
VVAPLAALQAQPEAASAGALREGIATLANQEYDRAFAQFEQAGAADPALASQAAMWMGIVRERQDRVADAEALYHRALAAVDRKSAEAATIMELHSRLLRGEGRSDEAARYEQEAAALRKQNGAPAPGTTPGVHRVGGEITAPQLRAKVEPQYTEEARAAKYEGKVVVYAEIGPGGVAENMSVLQGLGLGLNEKALEAISQWRFRPGMKDGQPVPVRATIEVNYRLF